VANEIPESANLDYKETLPGHDRRERNEFYKDLSSFANAGGGVILYGIRERAGMAAALIGIQGTSADEAEQRIGQMVRSGLDPVLTGCLLRAIPVPGMHQGFVLALGIPASLTAPHAVVWNNPLPFWRRMGTSKGPLSCGEVRQMFLEREGWERQTEEFRHFRVRYHTDTISGIPSSGLAADQPALLLHVLPLGRLARWIDLRPVRDKLELLFPLGNWPLRERYTFDGILRQGHTESPLRRGSLWFRFGGLEVAFATFGSHRPDAQPPGFQIARLTVYAAEYTHRALTAMDDLLGLPPPYAIYVNVLNTWRHVFEFTGELQLQFPHQLAQTPITEQHLLPPAAIFDQRPGSIEETVAGLRMIFDALWQAGGLPRCWLVDETGHWRGRDLLGWEGI
jgi:hypothetical protein